MENKISLKSFLKEFKTSRFVLECEMPMGYTEGFPILSIKNGYLCMTVPFLKYQSTGVVDQTMVFPIRYVVTVSLPDMKAVGYEDLLFNTAFEKVDFSKPIGLFRHKAISGMDKKEYKSKRDELISLYERLANALIFGTPYTDKDESNMSELLKMLLEPSLFPIYMTLDKDFYNKFLI